MTSCQSCLMLAISNLEGAQSRLHGGIDGAGKTPTTNDDLSQISCLISSAADLINNALRHAEAPPTAEEDAAGARPTRTAETHPAPDEVSVLTTTSDPGGSFAYSYRNGKKISSVKNEVGIVLGERVRVKKRNNKDYDKVGIVVGTTKKSVWIVFEPIKPDATHVRKYSETVERVQSPL